jgi:16S rRNA (cytosine967-C5)-methyltransferase
MPNHLSLSLYVYICVCLTLLLHYICISVFKVTSIEKSISRANMLTVNLERLKMTERCNICVADGTAFMPTKTASIDAVLLDAPCTATGTGRRHPQVLRKQLFKPTSSSSASSSPHVNGHKLNPSGIVSLTQLTSLQRALILNAVTMLKSGGVLVYAVCSLLEAEGECQAIFMSELERGGGGEDGGGGITDGSGGGVVTDGVTKKRALVLDPYPITPADVPGFEGAITEEGWLRILPGCLQGESKSADGFFVARFKKK